MTSQRVHKLRIAGERRVGERYDRSFVQRLHFIVQREDAVARAAAAVADERAAWLAEAARIAAPFGVDGRAPGIDPLIIDVLAWTHRDAGGHWRWSGRTNNKGSPVMRYRTHVPERNTEWSATRILHRLLAPDHEPPGAMQPRCDAPFVCVYLPHRCPTCALLASPDERTSP